MEGEFAGLSLEEEEDEILQIQSDVETNGEVEVLQLVGCFLTASIVHFPAMRSTMANVWHPVKGVQIRDLGEKRYLFQFFHIMDLERVLNGSPWTFNNHLLIIHKLQRGEDPLTIPLIHSSSWVQIHDVPIGFVSKNLAIQIGNFIGEFMEYDGSNMGKESRNFMRIRVRIDIRHPLKRKKQIMCYRKCSYVRFKYERLSIFYFYCGRLGHSDSFCEARIEVGVEAKEIGWDLSLRAQSCRAQTMTSVWLREESEGQGRGNGSRGGLCLAWRAGKNVQLQNFSKRHIDVIIDEAEEGCKWRFTGFYGSPYPQERAEAWNLLRHLGTAGELPWMVCGDVNEIMYSFEKKGGLPREEGRMEIFRKTLEECILSNLGFIGNWFTWERKNLPENNIQ
ncbi:hypothetical protein Gotri_000553 [Gossypium trilobum]|uniref:DUF4283 domain-containing protein n=1 Tax=Gossypium trilobum TaxID=34281 RepID=A0A7J9FDR5_9ROSI|nr:hypothetical protein [Gossypium trilobum]